MRGGDERSCELFSYVDLEARVRKDHPLRAIRAIVNEALAALEREFAALYSQLGRPSIAPEKLLRAMLLQAFYSIRSERQLMERLGIDEGRQAESGIGRTAGRRRRTQQRSGLPRPEANERHAWLDHRPGGKALQKGKRQGGEAVLHRAWSDGEGTLTEQGYRAREGWSVAIQCTLKATLITP